ncbi:V-type ATP synthase subunit C [Methanoregula formicica]|uniref:A-type ATP synthase subunit C n=1 Tax=Methanoregula formicica (strain DSM 22288 / NBRC 105244 / SMSP) TaxID=593750 RepID=L0HBI9_METFS|nr:V-type ATP synthase subunit C [Methanoregula formicica]AGB01390.1 ATP synthase A1, C subunit [Methanoregula formicica SMSP]
MGVNISAPYIYVCTRMRVRKAKLLPREEYMRMLNMSVAEITRVIEETEYKQEIDELGTAFKGIDLVEVALSWNLAKEYQKIQEIAPGTLKGFTHAYLRRWDIQNVLTILRGKVQGEKPGKIKEILIPAGSLDKVVLDRLLSEESNERIIELLKGHRMFPVLAREFPAAKESGSFSHMENELYKQFYGEILADAKSGIKGASAFLSYIQLEIDIKNAKTLFRLRVDAQTDEDVRDMFVTGGTLSVTDFTSLDSIRDTNEFIDQLKVNFRNESLHALLDELKGQKGSISDIEVRLTRVQLEQMEKMSKRNPFSIHPILVYLEKKKYEVFNLRALARGKESRLPSEKIAEYLVM